MTRDEIDEFGRCTAEFRNSIICFGEIHKIICERLAMLAANRLRQQQVSPGQIALDAYGESDFLRLSERMEEVLQKL